MIFDVAVGVALQRPPRIDEFRHVRAEAVDMTEAELTALQIAAATSVMPLWVGFAEDVPYLPEEWMR